MIKHKSIEGVKIFRIRTEFLKGAFAFPMLGIFIDIRLAENINLLRHEFGHILQFRKYGFLYFWFRIAPASIKSAFLSRKNANHIHMDTWTERNANQLAYNYYEKPADWDFGNYPI
ncbi:MAG: hypothetical protein Q7U47_01650 [Paludibacter sp.]|nr:hypothetical protein [Paludibacter sp.]